MDRMATASYRTRPVDGPTELAGGVLVVHCSDPRFQPHFQDFLRTGLGLDSYALVAVPGSAHLLTLTEYLPKFSWVGWRWMTFLSGLVQPRRVILLGHDDCRWYRDPRFHHLHGGSDEAQHDDLRRVRAEIAGRFPAASVETWFGRLDGNQAVFERQ
jgi:hypothetical protein